MSMVIILSMSVASVAAFLLTASRIKGFWFLVKHSTIVDIIFTIGAYIVFAGTITGMLIAVVAGLIMACVLSFMKWVKRTAQERTVDAQGIDDEHDKDGNWIYNQAPYV